MTYQEYPSIPQNVEEVGKCVLDTAFKVHSALGPGLLESVYEKALSYELIKKGVIFKTQVHIPIIYDGKKLDSDLICDLLVEDKVIVELKAVEKMNTLYEAQLITYLKLSGLRLGYLINFNVLHLKNGIKRLVC